MTTASANPADTTTARELTITRSVTVNLSREQAFKLFSDGFAMWWPYKEHSIGQATTVHATLEPGVGGRVFERTSDGTEHEWGRVLVWDPPSRLIIEWKPNRDAPAATEVEVQFTSSPEGTVVTLEHRGWERYGEAARAAFDSYNRPGGWTKVIELFANRAANWPD